MSVDGKGLLVIISAPSGGGKDVVIDQLVQKLADAVVYVTATSRKPRPGEADGVRYYFYSPEKFRQEIEAKAEMLVPLGEVYGSTALISGTVSLFFARITVSNEFHSCWDGRDGRTNRIKERRRFGKCRFL